MTESPHSAAEPLSTGSKAPFPSEGVHARTPLEERVENVAVPLIPVVEEPSGYFGGLRTKLIHSMSDTFFQLFRRKPAEGRFTKKIFGNAKIFCFMGCLPVIFLLHFSVSTVRGVK